MTDKTTLSQIIINHFENELVNDIYALDDEIDMNYSDLKYNELLQLIKDDIQNGRIMTVDYFLRRFIYQHQELIDETIEYRNKNAKRKVRFERDLYGVLTEYEDIDDFAKAKRTKLIGLLSKYFEHISTERLDSEEITDPKLPKKKTEKNQQSETINESNFINWLSGTKVPKRSSIIKVACILRMPTGDLNKLLMIAGEPALNIKNIDEFLIISMPFDRFSMKDINQVKKAVAGEDQHNEKSGQYDPDDNVTKILNEYHLDRKLSDEDYKEEISLYIRENKEIFSEQSSKTFVSNLNALLHVIYISLCEIVRDYSYRIDEFSVYATINLIKAFLLSHTTDEEDEEEGVNDKDSSDGYDEKPYNYENKKYRLMSIHEYFTEVLNRIYKVSLRDYTDAFTITRRDIILLIYVLYSCFKYQDSSKVETTYHLYQNHILPYLWEYRDNNTFCRVLMDKMDFIDFQNMDYESVKAFFNDLLAVFELNDLYLAAPYDRYFCMLALLKDNPFAEDGDPDLDYTVLEEKYHSVLDKIFQEF